MSTKICNMKAHILSRICKSTENEIVWPICSKCMLPLEIDKDFIRKRASRNNVKYYHISCGKKLNVI
jgi:hypothetical protein